MPFKHILATVFVRKELISNYRRDLMFWHLIMLKKFEHIPSSRWVVQI